MNKWNEETLFPLGEAYKMGQKMAADIQNRMTGRILGSQVDHGVLAQMVFNAGDGDHLSVGAQFGGRAILAGMIKNYFGMRGKVICTGAMNMRVHRGDAVCGVAASERTIFQNAKLFGMAGQMELIVATLGDAGLENRGGIVSSAILSRDGFHREYSDWNRAKELSERLVLMDGYQRGNDGVEEAMRIANEDRGWRCISILGVSAVFERVR